MNYIFTLATIGCVLFAFIWAGHLISLGYKWIVKKQKPTMKDSFLSRAGGVPPTVSEKTKWSLVVIVILSLFLYDNATFRELVGIHTIEDLNGGIHCYYVEISNGDNEYVLPGQISIDVENYYDDKEKYIRRYNIDRVYFPSGGYLDFSDYGENYVTDINDGVFVIDQDGREWSCKILDKHAYCPQIIETSYISTKTVVELLFTVAAVLYNWLGYVAWEENTD